MAPVQVTFSDKVGAVVNLGRMIAAVEIRAITYPFRRKQKARGFLRDSLYAGARVVTGDFTIAQDRFLAPSTERQCQSLARKHGLGADPVILESGAKAFWLGSRKADKVLLYCHGGGYVMSATRGHVKWAYNLTEELSKKHSFSTLFLAYTLAPEAQYPTQLQQAAEALQYLIETEGRKPSDIILGGDSAGGNLAASLLSHLYHPHSTVQPSLSLEQPLRGAILLSPWINFGVDSESFKRNKNTDILGVQKSVNAVSAAFLGDAPLDNYNQPSIADPSWFEGLDSVVSDIFIWGGGGEVLIDGIKDLATTLQKAHPRTEFVVQPDAAHEEFIMDTLFYFRKKADGTKVIEDWLAARL